MASESPNQLSHTESDAQNENYIDRLPAEVLTAIFSIYQELVLREFRQATSRRRYIHSRRHSIHPLPEEPDTGIKPYSIHPLLNILLVSSRWNTIATNESSALWSDFFAGQTGKLYLSTALLHFMSVAKKSQRTNRPMNVGFGPIFGRDAGEHQLGACLASKNVFRKFGPGYRPNK